MLTFILAAGFAILLVLLYFLVKASRHTARDGQSGIAAKRGYSGELDPPSPRATGSADD